MTPQTALEALEGRLQAFRGPQVHRSLDSASCGLLAARSAFLVSQSPRTLASILVAAVPRALFLLVSQSLRSMVGLHEAATPRALACLVSLGPKARTSERHARARAWAAWKAASDALTLISAVRRLERR